MISMITIILTILWVVVIVCYSLVQLSNHGKLKWSDDREWFNFWGRLSYFNKYKVPTTLAPKTWYYRFFKVQYKERFPGSATIFVAFTDGYHLSQWIMINSLTAIIAILLQSWIAFIVVRVIWWLVFNLCYKFLSK